MALVINGQRIDESVLGAEFAGVKSFFERQGNVSCCERDEEFRGYARENVIARVLLMQEAMATTAAPADADVAAEFEKVKQQHGGEWQFYAAVGATPEQAPLIKQEIAGNIRLERMLAERCAPESNVTDEELKPYYQEQIAAFTDPEEVRASHISKAPPRGDQREAAYELFRDIRRKLLEGADFDELAREHSDRGKEQIDLGYFKRGDLPEEFELVAYSMDVGEISPVFSSPVGYHIVKVTDRKPAAARPFEVVREEVKRLYREQKRQERIRELVKELQARAVIENVAEAEVAT